MGTRGFITFAVDGVMKTAYNHWDSYPSGLGLTVLGHLRDSDHAQMRQQATALHVASPDSKPAPEDIERLQKWMWSREEHGGDADLRTGQEWYDLLHETQGNIGAMLSAGVIEDASHFPADSLFAEWGYVIDFDNDGAFEVYRGFQEAPHSKGRFAALPHVTERSAGPYYPVALMVAWPLAKLPTDEEFLAATSGPDEEED